MFDLGMQELVVIFVVALVIFGPKRLPELARSMGKAMGQLKSAVSDVKSEVEREVRMAESELDLEEMPAWKKRGEGPAKQPPEGEEGEKSAHETGEEDQEAKPQETDPAEHESQDLEEDGRDK